MPGGRGFVGYSSVGKVVEDQADRDGAMICDVECVAADAEIPHDRHISFIKLDLQGGELNALKGMDRILRQPYFLWVEFTGQGGLAKHLCDIGYILFDTEYMFWGTPSPAALEHFEVTAEDNTSSTGRIFWKGLKKPSQDKDYLSEFARFREDFAMVQTDLVCVNTRYLDEFLSACDYLR